MINIAAIALLLSSLAAAGVWSPSPPAPNPTTVREGHRVIVVEYERHVPLEPSPPPPSTTHNIIENAKDKFQETSNLLPNVGQGVSMPEPPAAIEKPDHSAKELICDAYGVCKEKISNVFHKGKDKISRKASDVEESAKDAAEWTKEKASSIEESAKDAAEWTKEKASSIEESAKEAVKSKMESAKSAVKTKVDGVKDVVKNAEADIAANISHAADVVHRNLTNVASRARDVLLYVAKHGVSPDMVRTVASVAHLLAFATAYGTCVWVTFVSSHVLAVALPRQQFGMVQSKMYPVYFRAVAYAIAVACMGHFFAKKRVVGVERVQGYNLIVALGLVLANMVYFEPRATKVMFERMKMEKEEGRGHDMAEVLGEPVMTTTTTTTATMPSATAIGVTKTMMSMDKDAVKSRIAKLNKKMKKLNSYSAFLNIFTLMSLTWHLVHLSRILQMAC